MHPYFRYYFCLRRTFLRLRLWKFDFVWTPSLNIFAISQNCIHFWPLCPHVAHDLKLLLLLFTSLPPVEYPQIISILFLVRHSKPMQALPSIFMSMTLYVTGKNSMTLCVTASMTLCVTAKFCMTLCVTSSISLKIGCMTQKCMTQKYRPLKLSWWTCYHGRGCKLLLTEFLIHLRLEGCVHFRKDSVFCKNK